MKLVELLAENGIAYKTEGKHTRPGWLQLVCPFCHGDPYLGFNTAFNYFHCWRCGAVRLVPTVAELLGISYGKAKDLVGDLEKDDTLASRIPIRGKLVIPDNVGPLQKAHRQYLRQRNLDPKTVAAVWGIQGIGLSFQLPWRLFLPIYYQGKIVSWTTRSISDAVTSRYINAKPTEEILAAKSILYGGDYARYAIIICEGPLDALRIGPGAVATLGVGYTRSQLRQMAQFPIRAVAFDSEPKAQERAKKLCEALEVFDGKTFRVEVDAKDPGSASNREVRKLRESFLE